MKIVFEFEATLGAEIHVVAKPSGDIDIRIVKSEPAPAEALAHSNPQGTPVKLPPHPWFAI